MTLHVFNPEHDIALASNLPNFTAPRAARGLRSDLGYIPVLWAEDGDAVLVDDAAYAERQMEGYAFGLYYHGKSQRPRDSGRYGF